MQLVVFGLSIKRHSIGTTSKKDAQKHHGDIVGDHALQSFALLFIPFPLSWEAEAWESASKENVSVAAKEEGATSFHDFEKGCFLLPKTCHLRTDHDLWGLEF